MAAEDGATLDELPPESFASRTGASKASLQGGTAGEKQLTASQDGDTIRDELAALLAPRAAQKALLNFKLPAGV